MKNMAWKLVPGSFKFQRIIHKKDPEEVCMLIGQTLAVFLLHILHKQLASETSSFNRVCA